MSQDVTLQSCNKQQQTVAERVRKLDPIRSEGKELHAEELVNLELCQRVSKCEG